MDDLKVVEYEGNRVVAIRFNGSNFFDCAAFAGIFLGNDNICHSTDNPIVQVGPDTFMIVEVGRLIVRNLDGSLSVQDDPRES